MHKIANNNFYEGNTTLHTQSSKKKKLTLVITALLMVTALSHPVTSDAASDKNYKNPSHSGNNGTTSDEKITICHVPPGNLENPLTMTVSVNALKNGHLQEDKHLHNLDYIGSCKPPKASPIHVVSGCTGDNRTVLSDKVTAYYQAITVDLNNALNALFDASTVDKATTLISAMSQCLNSDKGNGANNAVTLNGITYHSIIGCQNKDKSYRTALVDADKAYDTLKGLTDPILVPVNSLDDSAVWSDYKTCAYTNGLVDPAKSSDKQGDIGHKYHLVNCDTTAHKDLLVTDINAYIAKPISKDIILTKYSIDNDASLEQAVNNCGGGFELGGSSINNSGDGVFIGVIVGSGGDAAVVGGGDGDGTNSDAGYLPAKGIEGRLNWKEINTPN